MNEKGNRYALAALRDKRATLASEIVQLERQLRHRREMVVHVDATLRILDPSVDPNSIPTKRPPQRVKLFRQGELGRMIIDALRSANSEPLSSAQIVAEVVTIGGYGAGARLAMAPRVRSNLAYLEKRRKVTRTGRGQQTCWLLRVD
jgi:hypothetical protein